MFKIIVGSFKIFGLSWNAITLNIGSKGSKINKTLQINNWIPIIIRKALP